MSTISVFYDDKNAKNKRDKDIKCKFAAKISLFVNFEFFL